MSDEIYSKDLGINLSSGEERERFKWFLTCLLFGKPIQQKVAKRTFLEFMSRGLDSPDKIIKAGWDKLVEVLDKGHYVRYDYSTATKLLRICKKLKKDYGSVTALLESANSESDLKEKLKAFKGIGPVTARIFIRDIA